jgi:hypothetical protein
MDHRLNIRHPVYTTALVRSPRHGNHRVVVLNISPDGAFVESLSWRPETCSQLILSFALPGSETRILSSDAIVVRVTATGFALEFDLEQDDYLALYCALYKTSPVSSVSSNDVGARDPLSAVRCSATRNASVRHIKNGRRTTPAKGRAIDFDRFMESST